MQGSLRVGVLVIRAFYWGKLSLPPIISLPCQLKSKQVTTGLGGSKGL